jgi:hypothetical protein
MKRLPALLGAVALTAVLLPGATDAASAAEPTVKWLCRPGLADNPCEISLDTTYQQADGTSRVATPSRPSQSKRKIDCFYVYPTVSNQITPNATAEAKPEILSIAKYQAARYSQVCRVFAPLYRQVTLVPGVIIAPLGGGKIAYGDVLAAWRSYLRNDNHGRGVVLIGHSQGSIMLRKLVREQIDPDRTARSRLVGALLLGGNVMVAQGKTSGGDFTNVKACTRAGQAGCVVAYSTYVNDPPPISFFGNASTDLSGVAFGLQPKAGSQVLCTDPGVLSGNRDDIGLMVPSEPFAPGIIQGGITLSSLGRVPSAETTWVSPPDRYQGGCKTINGATVFRYDPVGAQSRRPLEFPPLWGTHLFDGNLGLNKLVTIVQKQEKTYLANH